MIGGYYRGKNVGKVEVIDMKNESFTCNGIDDFPLPKHVDGYISGAGGLVDDKVPLVCGRQWQLQCFALQNRKWEFATNLYVRRAHIGGGKCLHSRYFYILIGQI